MINSAHVHKVVMRDTPDAAVADRVSSRNAHVTRATENATQISATNAGLSSQLGPKAQSRISIAATAKSNVPREKRYWWEKVLLRALATVST